MHVSEVVRGRWLNKFETHLVKVIEIIESFG